MWRINILALVISLVSVSAFAQAPEAEVRAAMKRTLDAYNKGDTTVFRTMFAPTVRGFFIDNSVMTGAEDLQALPPARGEPKPNVAIRQLSVRVHGNAAVLAGYFVGTMPVGQDAKEGTWRFTETRIKDGNLWKVVQFHFSPLDP